MRPSEQPKIDASYPMLKRLIRERHQTGRCATWDVWKREALDGIDQLWPNPGPIARLQRQRILTGYQIVGQLVEQLIGQSVAKGSKPNR